MGAVGPLVLGPDEPSTDAASISITMTMTFAVMGIEDVFNALANRRDPAAISRLRF